MNLNAPYYLISVLYLPKFNSASQDMKDVPDFIKVLE